MPVYYNSTKKCWVFQFRRKINGRPYNLNRCLPINWGRGEAEAFDRHETARLYAEASGLTKPRVFIADAVAIYVREVCGTLKRGKQYATELALLYEYYADRELQEAKTVSLEYAAAKHTILSPGTIKLRLSILRAAIKYAHYRHDMGETDYGKKMLMPAVDNAKTDYLTRAEMLQLMRACKSAETRAIIKILFYTGMRWRAELLPLSPDAIRDNAVHLYRTKNGAPHIIPLHPRLYTYLKRLPFLRHHTTYYEHFTRARDSIGLPNTVTMHTLRHSFATALLNAGENLDDVGSMLNHRSRASTGRYTHMQMYRRRQILDALWRAK